MVEASGKKQVDLTVELGRVRLANPVMTASGTCGYAFELKDFVDLSRIGGFVTKSITLEGREGNLPQRTFETASGMLNSIGLANVGLERFLAEKVPLLEKMTVPVFVNVAGRSLEDYVAVSEKLSGIEAISGLEINVSCPNVKVGGITFGVDPAATAELVGAIRKRCPETYLIVKLTPNVTDITVTARAAVEAGADALSLVNTFTGMAIDVEKRQPVLGGRTGGLSGPAIRPIAVHMVSRVYREVAQTAGVPIIGMGGICCAHDALEFIIAGASAVAVGTNVLVDPGCLVRIMEGIGDYLVAHDMKTVKELVGCLEGV
ncbi:MAG: dihydroorotate dehydrogenase [Sedimentisphaerales bacterium]|nr:dihydroorotate dehydrogenase [Sedimentisphaerales bacterium]